MIEFNDIVYESMLEITKILKKYYNDSDSKQKKYALYISIASYLIKSVEMQTKENLNDILNTIENIIERQLKENNKNNNNIDKFLIH